MRLRSHVTSRVVGIAAICLAPTFVFFGWWMLAAAVALGFAAGSLGPRAGPRGHRSFGRRIREAVGRRFGRRWRPGAR